MKAFVYTKTIKQAKYGQNVTIQVYRIKRNRPYYIGDGQYSTASTRGGDSEAYAVLLTNKQVNKKMYHEASGYYSRSKDNIKITEL